MTPASILVRFEGRKGGDRALGLRLALAAKRAWPASAGLPSDLDVLVAPGLPPGTKPAAQIRPDRVVLLVPRAYLGGERATPQELEREFREAFSLARPSDSEPGLQAVAVRTARGPKALFFRSLLNSSDKELGANHMYQGVFFLASALKKKGIPVVLVDGRMSLREGEFVTDQESLDSALAAHPDVNFVGLTLYDSYFEKALELMGHIRSKGSRAFLAVGSLMPTQNPFETLAHMPELNFIVRGAGEDAVCRILEIVGDSDVRTGLDESQIGALRRLKGVLYAQEDLLLLAGADHTLRVDNLDASTLDFSILEKSQLASGTVLSISRGCPYHCFFCTSMDKGRFVGKSRHEIANVLSAYGKRLLELYGRWSSVPPAAFSIGFYDDDLLSDRDWAISLFGLFLKSPFHIRFFQASISSFFLWRNGRPTEELDQELLDAMPPELFLPHFGAGRDDGHPHIYIGTENYCDQELERLGKTHRFDRVERLVRELSSRGIRQAHHLIVANAETTPSQVLENFSKIARLRAEYGPAFDVLRPVIPRLVSFYSSPSYKRMQLLGLEAWIEKRGTLSVPNYPEFDYPLVRHDLARDPDVLAFTEVAQELTSPEADWPEIYGRVRGFFTGRIETRRRKGDSDSVQRLEEALAGHGAALGIVAPSIDF